MRALDFYKQENAFLKMRLASALGSSTSADFVIIAENFQNNFIHNDECIQGLKEDIILFQKILKQWKEGIEADEKKLVSKYRRLNNEMR